MIEGLVFTSDECKKCNEEPNKQNTEKAQEHRCEIVEKVIREALWWKPGKKGAETKFIEGIKEIFIDSSTGAYSPGWTFGLLFRGFLITHTQTHGRIPLDE
jgi:hypothetical protein